MTQERPAAELRFTEIEIGETFSVDQAAFLTGVNLFVTGGQVMH